MDTQALQYYQQGYFDPEDSYMSSEQALHLFIAPTVLGPSEMASPFHTHPFFQDTDSSMHPLEPSQLFRDNGNAIHSSQAPESHHGYAAYHDAQSPMGTSHQAPVSDPQDAQVTEAQDAVNIKQEEADSACRPRLTPEQTRFLEEYFTHTPRPSTNQKKKHASELGLTHEKVNNWFQNRRAKSKQQTRIQRELNSLTPSNPRLQRWSDSPPDYHTPSLATSPLQYSETAEENTAPEMDTPNQLPKDPAVLHSTFWAAQAHTLPTVPYTAYNELQAMAHGVEVPPGMAHVAHQQHPALGSNLSHGIGSYEENASNWLFNAGMVPQQHTEMDRVSEHQQPVDVNGAILSVQHENFAPPAWIRNDMVVASQPALDEAFKQENVSLSPTNAQLPSQATSASISRHETPQRTPSPVMQPSIASYPFTNSAFSRRGSTTSELANNFNTIHLQKVSSQQNSDEEVFKTPKIPNLNLAARRKRQRPAALVSMRTMSVPGAAEDSPSSRTTSLPPSAVRRIKSAGNSLNVFNSRVQKSAASSAQRSPLNMTSRDTTVLERVNLSSRQMQEAGVNGLQHQSGQQQNGQQHQASTSPQEHIASQTWATSPSDSMNAPPLSASFTQNSYEEPSWASPPVTPFYPNPYNIHQMSGHEVPQSAPAHITVFPNMSPPMHAQPSTYLHAFYDTSFYAPVPMAPPVHVQSQLLKHYGQELLPTIARPGSGGAQYHFFGVPPPPPQKELEVVMADFPTPAKRPSSLPKIQTPHVFTFQNTGPKDYSAE